MIDSFDRIDWEFSICFLLTKPLLYYAYVRTNDGIEPSNSRSLAQLLINQPIRLDGRTLWAFNLLSGFLPSNLWAIEVHINDENSIQ